MLNRGLLSFLLILTPSIAYPATTGLWDSIANYERTYQCPEAELVSPESPKEVLEIVQNAILDGRKVMTGTKKFNSQIDAACAGGGQIQITTEKLNKITRIDKSTGLVTAQAGVRLYQLNEELRKNDLSINMISEGGFFSVGGMLGSDTHGSTMTQGVGLSEYVTAVTMVDGLGRMRVIEGDELLANRVNLGVLGVLVDATFRVESLKKVKATIFSGRDHDVAKVMQTLPRQHYSVSLSWFPGIKKYAATAYDFVPNDTPGEAINAQAHVPDWTVKAFKAVAQYANQPGRPFAECGLAEVRKILRSNSYFKENGKTMKNPVGWSDRMQYFTCNDEENCPWNTLPIVVGGFSIPMNKLDAWVDDVKAIIDAYSTRFTRPCFPLNGIYFRFGKGTDAWLAMNHGKEDTVFIDLEYMVNTKGMEDDGTFIKLNRNPKNIHVIREIEQISLQKYNARPHWGKNQASAFHNVGPKQYPYWESFIEYKKSIDPQNTFSNPWWERMIDGNVVNESKFKGCAFDGTCICETDEHCPEDQMCQKGLVWEQARVCRRP